MKITKHMKAIALAGVMVFAAGAAQAQDYSAVWDGFYGGIGVGYGWSEQKNKFEDVGGLTGLFDPDTTLKTDSDAAMSSIHLGRMWQRDSLVFGLEASGVLGDFNDMASAGFEIDEVIGSDKNWILWLLLEWRRFI